MKSLLLLFLTFTLSSSFVASDIYVWNSNTKVPASSFKNFWNGSTGEYVGFYRAKSEDGATATVIQIGVENGRWFAETSEGSTVDAMGTPVRLNDVNIVNGEMRTSTINAHFKKVEVYINNRRRKLNGFIIDGDNRYFSKVE